MPFSVISRLESYGWSWEVGRSRGRGPCVAYVHAFEDADAITAPMHVGEGATPEIALINAEAKALAAALPVLTPAAEAAHQKAAA